MESIRGIKARSAESTTTLAPNTMMRFRASLAHRLRSLRAEWWLRYHSSPTMTSLGGPIAVGSNADNEGATVSFDNASNAHHLLDDCAMIQDATGKDTIANCQACAALCCGMWILTVGTKYSPPRTDLLLFMNKERRTFHFKEDQMACPQVQHLLQHKSRVSGFLSLISPSTAHRNPVLKLT